MRLIALLPALCILAIDQLARVSCLPAPADIQVESRPGLKVRAPPGSYYATTIDERYAIPMTQVGQGTYQGKVDLPFTTALTLNQMQTWARETYHKLIRILGNPDYPYLVAVIYVPGKGVVAGTIWHGSPLEFHNNMLAHAPILLNQLRDQHLLNRYSGASLYHAEIVAAQKAEITYRDGIHAGANQWRPNTVYAVFGQKEKNGPVGFWLPCSHGNTQVYRTCDQTLANIGMRFIGLRQGQQEGTV